MKPPSAPWELQTDAEPLPESILAGDRMIGQGNLQGAAEQYLQARNQLDADNDARGTELAVARRVGTLLKMGRSKETLSEVSTYLNKRGTAISAAPTEIALVVSYAYLHQAQLDQTLAWLGVAVKNAPGERSGRYVRDEARKLVRSLPEHNFETYADKWGQDPSIGSLFGQERLRRSQGGKPEIAFPPGLFTAVSYTTPVAMPDGEAAVALPSGDGSFQPGIDPDEIVIGVLLPFTGRYADHSVRVREGVELAVSELSLPSQLNNGARVRVVYGDTKGDGEVAASEYRRLVGVEHAAAVIGPLLVKDTERVAAEAASMGVPYVTFTKQPQTAGLGKPGFRLGATIENQAAELAGYAVKQLGLRRLAVALPANQAGRDFAAACRAAVSRSGAAGSANGTAGGQASIVGEIEYQNGDDTSIAGAVDSLSKLAADGVFVPDSLENSIPLLDAARAAGLRPVFLGTALWDDAVTIRGYGSLIDGAVYVTPFFSQSSEPATASFVAGYRSRFSREPDLLAAQAYDATHYILRGLELSGKPVSPSYPALLTKNLLSADTFEGATGKISVGKNGDLSRRMSVLRLHNGQAVEVMSGGETKGLIPDGEESAAQNKQG